MSFKKATLNERQLALPGPWGMNIKREKSNFALMNR